MARRQSLRPESEVGAIIFPKKGSVRHESEALPRAKAARELKIGQKFAGALTEFRQISITSLRNAQKAEEPSDLIGKLNGQRLGIQVAEIRDAVDGKIQDQHQSYPVALHVAYPEAIARFNGYDLALVDAASEPFLPPVASPAGQKVLAELASRLDDLAAGLASLADGAMRHRRWSIGPGGTEIFVSCMRLSLPIIPAVIRWTGNRAFKGDEYKQRFLSAFAGKLNKHYYRPSHPFWLLVYSTDTIARDGDPMVEAARQLFDTAENGFDSVWFFGPYHWRDSGHILPIWPGSVPPMIQIPGPN